MGLSVSGGHVDCLTGVPRQSSSVRTARSAGVREARGPLVQTEGRGPTATRMSWFGSQSLRARGGLCGVICTTTVFPGCLSLDGTERA